MGRTCFFGMLVLVCSQPAGAQLVVFDAAVTLRNSVTASVKAYELATQRDQHEQLRRMAARLSAVTNLTKYIPPQPPEWRLGVANGLPVSRAYNAALHVGDRIGSAYVDVVQPVIESRSALQRLALPARRALTARLATIDLADAASVAGLHDAGQLRSNGRRHEQGAIDALEAHVVDPSSTQSATAVLDKISGAILIGARQRQARMQLVTGLVEQFLVDGKRARDTDAVAVNMQVVTWRHAQAANQAFVAGTGDALRTWRQP